MGAFVCQVFVMRKKQQHRHQEVEVLRRNAYHLNDVELCWPSGEKGGRVSELPRLLLTRRVSDVCCLGTWFVRDSVLSVVWPFHMDCFVPMRGIARLIGRTCLFLSFSPLI